ncbi:MAG: DUF5682 family protein [Peptococcaceae bacterium]|nr:DUF5682 family protein [Peptococcaceae bacterium]
MASEANGVINDVATSDFVIQEHEPQDDGPRFFGIRHLSAAGAWHLKSFLDAVQPELVLIESPSDTTPLIADLCQKGVKPPVAIMCYTTQVPVHSLLYPLAAYSPEYQGILWAHGHRKECRFIDLPSAVKAPLYQLQEKLRILRIEEEMRADAIGTGPETEGHEDAGHGDAGHGDAGSEDTGHGDAGPGDAGSENAEPGDARSENAGPGEPTMTDDPSNVSEWFGELSRTGAYYRYNSRLYDRVAEIANEKDFESYWERYFEHNLATDVYLKAVTLHSTEMRALTAGYELEAAPLDASINALREGYMKRCINQAIAEGYSPGRIVVILGAYHVAGVMACEPMSDEELARLDRVETRVTLMPYSYYRLSSFSGYGAGNNAPFYYEMMYNAMEKGTLDALPSRYLTEVSRVYREKHGYSSTASVIEGVRLARSLQYFHKGLLPTLADLHDSAVATLAGGEITAIIESFAAVDVGTCIGELPEGVSQTPVQDDMNRQIKILKLEKYKSVVKQTLDLDLRENRRVQSEIAAFLDLERSVFLHRLAFLGIGFAYKENRSQENASWAECWMLVWTPEVEIQVVETVLLGDTIKAAAAYLLKDRLEKTVDVLEVAALVRVACECRMEESIPQMVARLQELATESESFTGVAGAAREISFLIQYGSLRRFATEPFAPILRQLFLKGSLLLYPSASCNDETAREMAEGMTQLHLITQENDDLSDDIWLAKLEDLALAHDRNPYLCGFAFSILMERGKVEEDKLAAQVSLHLSPGNTAQAGAAWFEGLSRRNRYLLLSRLVLWQQLDVYLEGLDDEGFKRAMVCLRRAFAAFEPNEKAGVCDILAELWGIDAGRVGEYLQEELSEEENKALDDLGDFDFDF